MIAFSRAFARVVAKRPRCYLVVSPYTWTERILDDGSGPTYHENAVLFVRTTSKRRAKNLAVIAWRRAKARRKVIGGGIPDAIADGENPFRGMKCEQVDGLGGWEPLLAPIEAFA